MSGGATDPKKKADDLMKMVLESSSTQKKTLDVIFVPLAFLQARFQAQQMAEREEKMIQLLETRQEEAVRRVAHNGNPGSAGGVYGSSRGESANSHSANSMSSNNRYVES